MSFDVAKYLRSVLRSVTSLEKDGNPARAVTLGRTYDTTAEDLWDALTNPERLPRWFLPVEGDLREGGRYQLRGNAGGTINKCDPPIQLDLTWEYAGDISWVEVRLTPHGAERTQFALVHTAHVGEYWNTYGPGAVGIGWDLSLIGLEYHLDDPEARFDEESFSTSAEGQTLIKECGNAWARADTATGIEQTHAYSAAARAIAFFMGDTQKKRS